MTATAAHRNSAALCVLGVLASEGRLTLHPQDVHAYVDLWQRDVLLAAMEVEDRHTDNQGREHITGWLLNAWRLRLVVDADVTAGVNA